MAVPDRSLTELQHELIEERGEMLQERAREIAAEGIELSTRGVIITAEGKGGVKERPFGSASMDLMRKCPRPVWVIKPKPARAYNRILAAVDVANPVRRASALPSASFRFNFTVDRLGVRLTVPLAVPVEGLQLEVIRIAPQ